jgi:hypothetical protein
MPRSKKKGLETNNNQTKTTNKRRRKQNKEVKQQKKARQETEIAFLRHHHSIDKKIHIKYRKNKLVAMQNSHYNAACNGTQQNTLFGMPSLYDCGRMNHECERGCGAMHFLGESTRNMCCDENGHGNFEELHETPEFLHIG